MDSIFQCDFLLQSVHLALCPDNPKFCYGKFWIPRCTGAITRGALTLFLLGLLAIGTVQVRFVCVSAMKLLSGPS